MAEDKQYAVHFRPIKLDMTGAKRLGDTTRDTPSSICWYCKRPVGDCQWLMERKPYKGTEYYSFTPVIIDCQPMETYNIQYCPKHIEPTPDEYEMYKIAARARW